MSILFPHLPFQNDETPMSWAARQAAFHTGGRVVPFLNDLKIPVADLVCGKRDAVERLCMLTGQDPAPVFANTIISLGNRRYRLRGYEFSAELMTGGVTRFCPLCLHEDCDGQTWPKAAMRHRLHWRLSPIRTCRKHSIPLTDARMGKWTDMLHEVQAMGDALSAACNAAHSLHSRDPSPLQAYVEDRLERTSGPVWLDSQGLDQVCRTVEVIGALDAFGPEQKATEMTVDMWDRASRVGWPMVRDGDAAITKFLSTRLSTEVALNGHPSPRNSFGMLYGCLFASRLSKDPGPIRDIVRNVVIENVPLVPGQELLGKRVTCPRLASIASIAGVEGLHPKTLMRILRLAGMIDYAHPPTGARNVVVEYAKAKPLIERAKHATSVTRVPYMLSASRPMVSALIELGHLRRIQDHAKLQSKVGKAIDGRSIDEVLQFIGENFEAVRAVPKGHVRMAKAAEKTKVTLLTIIEMLFGQQLKSVHRVKGRHGFDAVVVLPAEITECIKTPPQTVSDEI